MKWCPRCEQIKPVQVFHLNGRQADGRSSWCRVCVLEYAAEYRDRPGHRDRARVYSAAWRERRRKEEQG